MSFASSPRIIMMNWMAVRHCDPVPRVRRILSATTVTHLEALESSLASDCAEAVRMQGRCGWAVRNRWPIGCEWQPVMPVMPVMPPTRADGGLSGRDG